MSGLWKDIRIQVEIEEIREINKRKKEENNAEKRALKRKREIIEDD